MRLAVASLFFFLLATRPASADACCVVPDNGSGTADLPPDCPPDGYAGILELIEGLPQGGTLDMDARLTDIVVSSQTPGGSLGGTVEVFTASMHVEVTGGGTLSGVHRNLVVPVTGETHSAPRTPGDPVQTFAIDVYRLQGILTADYDFNVFWFEGGSYYGLPSPGHTTLTRQGGPGSGFAAESTFHYFYRIQFDGRQESKWLEGYRGITLDLESDFVLCAPAALDTGEPSAPAPSLAVSENPFRNAIEAVLHAPLGPVSLSVFDSQGRLVRTLVRDDAAIEDRRAAWDGRDDRGRTVPAGTYYLRLTAGNLAVSHRIVRLP